MPDGKLQRDAAAKGVAHDIGLLETKLGDQGGKTGAFTAQNRLQ